MSRLEDSIIGPSDYSLATELLPGNLRRDFRRLYSFVRVADDYVDQLHSDINNFLDLKARYNAGKIQHSSLLNQRVINNILELTRQHEFDRPWVEAFWASMQSDLKPQKFDQLDDSLTYVYGSAEVIGLMLAKIMGVPEKAWLYARMQGRAWQWLNFIRDIQEDGALGRCYFPGADLRRFGLADLSESTARDKTDKFKDFIYFQLDRYKKWQSEAEKGYYAVPSAAMGAIRKAAAKYQQTAANIASDPLAVFKTEIRRPVLSKPASLHR